MRSSPQSFEDSQKSFLGKALYASIAARCDKATYLGRDDCFEFSSALIVDLIWDGQLVLGEKVHQCEQELSILEHEGETKACDQASAIAMDAQGLQLQIRQIEQCIEKAQIKLSYSNFEASSQLDSCMSLANRH